MQQVRGARISMIFQEPMTSLNPVFTIGSQIHARRITLHQTGGEVRSPRAIEMLRKVRIPEPERRMKDYPHQFSGGMRQRAMIAIALACNAAIADCRRADHGAGRDRFRPRFSTCSRTCKPRPGCRS